MSGRCEDLSPQQEEKLNQVGQPIPQIYTKDTRPCAILIPAWDSIWGLWVCPVIKIIVVHQVRKLPAYTAV